MLEKQEIIIRQPAEKTICDGKSQACTFCDILSYEPTHIEEVSLGSLFFISRYAKDSEESDSLINLINSTLKRTFYAKPQLGTLESLKASLKETNRLIDEFLQQHSSVLGNNLFYSFLVVKDQTMHLAASGQNLAWLYRRQLINLNKTMVPPPEKQLPGKFFQSLISGELEEGDKIILSTPALARLVDEEGIKQLLKTKELVTGAEKINKLIREAKEISPLAVLLLRYFKEEKEPSQKDDQNKEHITPPISLEEILR